MVGFFHPGSGILRIVLPSWICSPGAYRGSTITTGLIAEFKIRAKELDKHILIFVKTVERQSQAVRLLLKELDRKYATFSSLADLRIQTRKALDQTSALSIRAPRTRLTPSILQSISTFVGSSTLFRVTPIVPRTSSTDLFQVRQADPHIVTLYKTESQETISIPTNRLKEILDTGADMPKVLVLDGRLQHITSNWRWIFFEDKPDPSSELGFVRPSSLSDPRVLALTESLRTRLDFYWSAVEEVQTLMPKGWVVCYDDDGRCFFIRDPVRDTILIVKRKF